MRIVNYGNTRKVVNSRLSQGEGGLSGPDIFPTTLENLRRTRRVFGKDFDIIATGGVDSPDKAAQLLDEGATAVGYFTGFVTRGPILRAADPRATRREPLSHGAPAALKMLTAYPLVHHYPQTTKSHGLTRAHERTAGI